MSRRPLEPEERALWHQATGDVASRRRAAQRPVVMAEELAAADADAARRSPPVPPAPSPPSRRSSELAPDRGGGLDRRTAVRLKRGQLAIEARLDLHGMIQEEAHRALTGFIGRAVAWANARSSSSPERGPARAVVCCARRCRGGSAKPACAAKSWRSRRPSRATAGRVRSMYLLRRVR